MGLPVLDSDKDFLDAFLNSDASDGAGEEKKAEAEVKRQTKLNKHGLPFLDDYETWISQEPSTDAPAPAKGGTSFG